MLKQKISKSIKNLSRTRQLGSVVLIAVFGFGVIVAPLVLADSFDVKINQLAQDNAQKSDSVDQLGEQADSLQQVVNKLQAKIDAAQTKINTNQAEAERLQVEIKKAEAELKKQKALLGVTIKEMYLDGQITTVELLASSNNLSDFFDKQQYRESVRSKIKTTLDKVTQLRLDLNTRKENLEALIKEQEGLRNQLAAQQGEKNHLLSLNQSERSNLSSKIKKNSQAIERLRAEQAAANAAAFGGTRVIAGHNGRDTYPNNLRNAPQDSVVDPWGMYNRECVSYTAWKVYASGRHMPYWGGRGNANQWDDNARAAGIPVDTKPRRGDVAVAHWGYYGHVMYVESVNANGTINVSQYNFDFNGTYSEAYGLSKSGLVFIHFR